MKDYSIELFRKTVLDDLNRLESSHLKKVNIELYNDLKQKFQELDKKIALYETKSGNVTREGLGNEWASLSAIFDFYMDTTGTKQVLNYQVAEIKNNLLNIAKEVNENNYEVISKKFHASLDLYSKILNIAFKSNEINELINEFNYQVLKHKINAFVLDDSNNLNNYIKYILEDIEKLLNSNEVSNNIKENLKLYALDSSIIIDNFEKVLKLIVLGENKKQVSNEELNKYLKRIIYKESDIRKDYTKPDKETREYVNSNFFYSLNDIEKRVINKKELILEIIIQKIKSDILNDIKLSVIVQELIENNFQYINYLAKALIENNMFNYLLKFRNEFKKYGMNYDYEFDCAVIAYRDDIHSDELAEYIIATDNEFLINYIIKNKIDIFNDHFDIFIDRLIEYIIDSHNPKLMAYLQENILNISLRTIIYSKLDNNLKKKAIDNEITKHIGNTKELYDIFNLFDKINDNDLQEFITKKIISMQNVDILMEYTRRLKGSLGKNVTEVLEQMEEGNFKKQLLDVLYDSNSEWGKILISNNNRRWQEGASFYIEDYQFKELTMFEAAYVSKRLNEPSNLLLFVKIHQKARLDWTHLYELSKDLTKEERDEFNKYFYLGNKELFFQNLKDIDHNFILKMINEYPESIVDFLKYLFGKEIIQLPNSTLDIFIKYYEEKINKEDISLNDRVHNTLSKYGAYYRDISDIVELLTYIMQTGIINNEILMYAKALAFKESLNPVFVKAVQNSRTPYLRASFVNKLYSLNSNEWNMIFLNDKEKEDIINSSEDNEDSKDLKMRKYYGDLLKLIQINVPENIKYRIAIEIAKSKIEEYINYIIINYPELTDIILENINDTNLYKKIMEASLSVGRK